MKEIKQEEEEQAKMSRFKRIIGENSWQVGDIFNEGISISHSYISGKDQVPAPDDNQFAQNLGRMARVLTQSISDFSNP